MLLGLPSCEWSPRSLFADGEQGGWYDPSDISTLWQDDARTTPVTAAGQTVGAIDDKSGRGNHLLQATTTKRGLYQIDATGRPYVQTDGAGDCYQTAAFAAGSDACQIFAGVDKLRNTLFEVLLETSATSVTNNGTIALNLGTGSLNESGARSRGTVRADAASTGSPTGLAVLSNIANIAAPSVSLVRDLSTLSTSTATQGTGNYGTHVLNVGGRNNGASATASVRIYGLILRFGADLSPGTIQLANRWMARKTGVTF